MPDQVGHDGDGVGNDGDGVGNDGDGRGNDGDGRGSGSADRLGFPIEVRHDVNGLTTI